MAVIDPDIILGLAKDKEKFGYWLSFKEYKSRYSHSTSSTERGKALNDSGSISSNECAKYSDVIT